MGALPIFAPDGVERSLATQPGTIPQLAAARFGKNPTFQVSGGTAPFTSSIGNDESQNIAYTLTPQPVGSFGNLLYVVTCTMQTTNQSITYAGPTDFNGPETFTAPNLISIDPNNLNGGSLSFSTSNPSPFTTILFPVLESVAGTISITSGDAFGVGTIQFPALQSTAGITINTTGPLLTSLVFPQYTPGDSESDDFSDNALNVASVNGILEQWAKNTSFTGTLNLSDGTSAAPTGAGATAKAALITQGATVTTN